MMFGRLLIFHRAKPTLKLVTSVAVAPCGCAGMYAVGSPGRGIVRHASMYSGFCSQEGYVAGTYWNTLVDPDAIVAIEKKYS